MNPNFSTNFVIDDEQPSTSKAAAERRAKLEAATERQKEEKQELLAEKEDSDQDIEEMNVPLPNLQCEMIEDLPDCLRPKRLKTNTSAEYNIEHDPAYGPWWPNPLGFCTSSTSVVSSSASDSTVGSKSVAEQLREEPQEPENNADEKNGVLRNLLKWYTSAEYNIDNRAAYNGPSLGSLLGFTDSSTSVVSSSASDSTMGSKSVAKQFRKEPQELETKSENNNENCGEDTVEIDTCGRELASPTSSVASSLVTTCSCETISCGIIYVNEAQQNFVVNCSFCGSRFVDIPEFAMHLLHSNELNQADGKSVGEFYEESDENDDNMRPLAFESCGKIVKLYEDGVFAKAVCGQCKCKFNTIALFENHLRQHHKLFSEQKMQAHKDEKSAVAIVESEQQCKPSMDSTRASPLQSIVCAPIDENFDINNLIRLQGAVQTPETPPPEFLEIVEIVYEEIIEVVEEWSLSVVTAVEMVDEEIDVGEESVPVMDLVINADEAAIMNDGGIIEAVSEGLVSGMDVEVNDAISIEVLEEKKEKESSSRSNNQERMAVEMVDEEIDVGEESVPVMDLVINADEAAIMNDGGIIEAVSEGLVSGMDVEVNDAISIEVLEEKKEKESSSRSNKQESMRRPVYSLCSSAKQRTTASTSVETTDTFKAAEDTDPAAISQIPRHNVMEVNDEISIEDLEEKKKSSSRSNKQERMAVEMVDEEIDVGEESVPVMDLVINADEAAIMNDGGIIEAVSEGLVSGMDVEMNDAISIEVLEEKKEKESSSRSNKQGSMRRPVYSLRSSAKQRTTASTSVETTDAFKAAEDTDPAAISQIPRHNVMEVNDAISIEDLEEKKESSSRSNKEERMRRPVYSLRSAAKQRTTASTSVETTDAFKAAEDTDPAAISQIPRHNVMEVNDAISIEDLEEKKESSSRSNREERMRRPVYSLRSSAKQRTTAISETPRHDVEHAKTRNRQKVNNKKKKRHVCDKCDKSFEKPSRLADHNRLHTGEKPYRCDNCGKAFRLKMRLTEHQQRHKEVKDYICDTCGASMATRQDLRLHKRHHAKDKRHQCPDCPKAFVRGTDLKIHVRIHTGEKPFECEICQRAFRANQNLIAHRRCHSDDGKKFKCTACGKRFMRNVDLKVHHRTHTGERPYKCEICGRAYSSSAHCRAHLQREHGPTKKMRKRQRRKPDPKNKKE